ncbi:high nitrogen upregulated cytochrome P450 monooxygenase 2 [Trametes sanguinea]|nr:high nitrogen upregulated cytochrome P450 monooxygenase 2 [Trametes sanguinea]
MDPAFPPQISMEGSLLVVCAMGLISHQFFRRLETYVISTHMLLLGIPPAMGFFLLRNSMSQLAAAALSCIVFLSSVITSVTIYRLSPFHPLGRYPGPVACKLSKFWMAGISLTGRQHTYIQNLHRRYGDVVRIGPNELSIRDPSVLNPMLGIGGLPKGPIMVGRILTATNLPLVGILDPDLHAERRKPWNRAFSAVALKEYEPLIANRVTQLVRVLSDRRGEIDIGRFFNYFSYDFMMDMAYGGGSELLRDGDTKNIWHTMEAGWPAATALSHVPYLGPYGGRVPAIAATVDRLVSYCRKFTLKRIERGSERKDIFHYLNNEDQPEKPSPPISQLLDDGILAIVAGSDTTSSALTSLAFCLATHPPALGRLQAEIDKLYPAGEDPCAAVHYRDMHYLTAVIHETLRLYPPVPSGMHRRVPHGTYGVMLGPYFVPGGTSMFLHPYSLHRDPRYFSPFTDGFWPERWLVAAGRISLGEGLRGAPDGYTKVDSVTFKHNEAAFLPFSHGPGNCVGKQLAMQEMRAVVCALLQKFDLRLREGWDVREYDRGFKDYFVTTRPEVPMTLQARF